MTPWEEYNHRRRQEAAALYAAVLEAAVVETREVGVNQIRREKVAKRAGVGAGTVNNAFGSMSGLCAAVMSEAVSKQYLDIIAQGLAIRDPIALGADSSLKARALATLTQ